MSNTVLAAIIVPIVVALALAAWIIMVYRADRHPGFAGSERVRQPRREVTGGSFRGPGGRQVMPLPGQSPASDDADQVAEGASYHDAARAGGNRNTGRAGSTG